MQPAVNIARQVARQPSTKCETPSQPAPQQTPKLRQGLLDKLWLKMTEMYGHRWTASFGVSADQGHAWAAALGGLSRTRIASGLAALAARGDDWPPSAPEFRRLCEGVSPETMGLPNEERAYREACRIAHPAADRSSVHPAVYHAACETGLYELANLSQEKSRRLFSRAYAVTVRMIANGEPLREIPKALPETVSVRTPEVGRAALAGLRKSFRKGATA